MKFMSGFVFNSGFIIHNYPLIFLLTQHFIHRRGRCPGMVSGTPHAVLISIQLQFSGKSLTIIGMYSAFPLILSAF